MAEHASLLIHMRALIGHPWIRRVVAATLDLIVEARAVDLGELFLGVDWGRCDRAEREAAEPRPAYEVARDCAGDATFATTDERTFERTVRGGVRRTLFKDPATP